MEYRVYEDLVGATEIKIHEEDCSFVNKDDDADTTKWHGPFDFDEAKSVAESLSLKYKKGWKNAGCCVDKGP